MTIVRGAAISMTALMMSGGLTTPALAQEPDGVQMAQLERRMPATRADMQLSLAPIVSQASPAVVNVYAKRVVRQRRHPLEDFMRGLPPGMGGMTRERIQQSLGSGVLVRGDGLIVTNNHVIEGADELNIVLNDRREFKAKLILADPRSDLAVLRIDTKGERLPALSFADTRQAQVGDLVIAIGNPLGLNQTVTSGIISALARTEVGINDFNFFIQTDAAINQGNSGGALVDTQGRLIGINTAILSGTGGSIGIGFAIPAEMVQRVVESAVGGAQTIVRPWLGVAADPVTSDAARAIGLERPMGVLVKEIFEGGPGDRAGLRRGDVVLKINGVDVHDEQGVRYAAATARPGTQMSIEILRGAERRVVQARADPPPRAPLDPRQLNGQHPLDGTRVINLSPAVAEEKGLSPFASGVFIDAMDRRGQAARLGFQPGDIVRAVNQETVRNTADLQRMIAQPARGWVLTMERNGEVRDIQIGF
jgi:Do/DeqQ family serine protease